MTSPVVRHFTEMGHHVNDLRCIGLEQVWPNRRGGDIHKQLLKHEAFYIYELKSFTYGLNEELDLVPFLYISCFQKSNCCRVDGILQVKLSVRKMAAA